MSRLFTADYGNRNVNQWSRVQNKDLEVASRLWPSAGHYPNTVIVDDPDCGYVNRFEVRNGDIPAVVTTGERSDVTGDADSYAAVGTTRWYALSIKFDETFPTSHDTIGWDTITAWKGCKLSPYTEYGSQVIGFGWTLVDAGQNVDGKWHLMYSPQSAPLEFVNDYTQSIFDFPLNPGQWQDIKLRVLWKQDYSGTVQLWHNGERQTFNENGGGGTTFTGQTVCGGDPTGVMVHQGIYRQSGSGHGRVGTTGATEIITFKNFRMADSEAGL